MTVATRIARKHLSARKLEALFDEHNGECHICRQPIRPGEAWDRSHPIPLAIGGSDTPDNWAPAHRKCHAVQTAKIDAALIAKTRRQHQKHLGVKPERKHRWPKRSFSRWSPSP